MLWIHEVAQPLTVRNGDHDVTIADKGMTWLQIAMPDQHVWVTAMFDDQGHVLQIYFDITNGNCLEPADNPTFEDMYLDIVMEPDGALYVLDRDELDEALKAKQITEKQHARTVEEGERLYRWLEEHGQAFILFCCEQRMKLKELRENGKA